VIAGRTAIPDAFRSQQVYEEFRSQALTGSSLGDPRGLVVLLREGVAAWLAWLSTGQEFIQAQSQPPHRQRGPALLSDEVHAAVVRVLATMVLGGGSHSYYQGMNS
jgi:hypothetical protein